MQMVEQQLQVAQPQQQLAAPSQLWLLHQDLATHLLAGLLHPLVALRSQQVQLIIKLLASLCTPNGVRAQLQM